LPDSAAGNLTLVGLATLGAAPVGIGMVSFAMVAGAHVEVPLTLAAPAGSACADGFRDNTETDVDCGGGGCPACAIGKACGAGSDCATKACFGGHCRAAS